MELESGHQSSFCDDAIVTGTFAALCAITPTFHGEGWVQVNGLAEIVSLPRAFDMLVYLRRQVYGEHKNWSEFHERMIREKRVIIRIDIESVGPKVRG